jgi:hypothetical protein
VISPTNSFNSQPISPVANLLGWLIGFSSGFGQDPGFGAQGTNPYAPQPGGGAFAPTPPPKKSNFWLWLLGGLGIATVLVCGCCGGLSWWGISASNKIITQFLREEVQGSPVVAEHLGEITALNTNLIESGEAKQKRGGTNNVLVIDAEGTKGSGKFIVEQSPSPQPGRFFERIDLRLPSGEEISVK